MKKGTKISEETRKKMSGSKIGKKNPMYGKTHSKKIRTLLSKINKGKNNYFYGKSRSEETKRKISVGNKGKIVSIKTRKKISESKIGHKLLEETKRKISKSMTGKKHKEDTKKKIRLAHVGNKHYNWKGGKYTTYKGYVRLSGKYDCLYSNSQGSISEHKYIWWKYFPDNIMKKDECIHHINGNKQDNRIENLKKMKTLEHTKLHKFLRKERIK